MRINGLGLGDRFWRNNLLGRNSLRLVDSRRTSELVGWNRLGRFKNGKRGDKTWRFVDCSRVQSTIGCGHFRGIKNRSNEQRRFMDDGRNCGLAWCDCLG